MSIVITSCGQTSLPKNQTSPMDTSPVIKKTDTEWKKILTDEQYFILREKGTERPFTGKFLMHKEKGTYTCAACGNPLFTDDMKFDSHCGWPSFDKQISSGAITMQEDYSHGMHRTEIICGRCGGHLGHIFDDGPTETGKRYCVNSVSLGFEPVNAASKTRVVLNDPNHVFFTLISKLSVPIQSQKVIVKTQIRVPNRWNGVEIIWDEKEISLSAIVDMLKMVNACQNDTNPITLMTSKSVSLPNVNSITINEADIIIVEGGEPAQVLSEECLLKLKQKYGTFLKG